MNAQCHVMVHVHTRLPTFISIRTTQIAVVATIANKLHPGNDITFDTFVYCPRSAAYSECIINFPNGLLK